ncbi:hypothetical protein C6A85_000000107800 [Mycobacterium sp. ITM-2017-0098]|nr:hypothetical protein C6A85_000000107800 [Mycobacterium sp. ITM-2017-0098]
MAFKLTYSDGQESQHDDDTVWELDDGVLKLGREKGKWSVLLSPSHWAVLELGGQSKGDDADADAENDDEDSDDKSESKKSRHSKDESDDKADKSESGKSESESDDEKSDRDKSESGKSESDDEKD